MQVLKDYVQKNQAALIRRGLYTAGTLTVFGGFLMLYALKQRQYKAKSSLRDINKVQGSRKASQQQQDNSEIKGTIVNTLDHSSLSNLDQVVTQHSALILTVDFAKQVISGTVTLTMRPLKPIQCIKLDCKLLDIKSVQRDGIFLDFNIKTSFAPALGDQLIITLDLVLDHVFDITIQFETCANPGNEQVGLNWLNPQQTFGGKHPFLFSQCEPIYARSIFPCQDSPAIKSTFDFQVSVSEPYTVFVSGLFQSKLSQDGVNTFIFHQPVPIPSYLFAIVVGELQQVKINHRNSVISEPCFVEKCAKEFEDMEKYLAALEKYISAYKWKEFNIVVLPLSFPFGGMENPNLTFLSPSVVVGDKSATSVVIHEMAHSWSGNGVTCQNWECFWLNEGMTVFFENEVYRELFGEEAYELKTVNGINGLRKAIGVFGDTHSYTSLSPELNQANPDDCFSQVPYEKGYLFLRYLQNKIGRQQFQQFMRTIVEEQVLNTEQFKHKLEQFIKNNNIQQFDIMWNQWVKQPGQAPVGLEYENQVNIKYHTLVDKFMKGELELNEFEQLSVAQKVQFLDLLSEQEYDQNTLRNLEEDLEILHTQNPEIISRFLVMGINKGYPQATGNILTEFLKKNGRMKFIKDIYRALGKHNQQLGRHNFQLCRSGYHSIANVQIARMLE